MRTLMGVLFMLACVGAVEAAGLKPQEMAGWSIVAAEDALPVERYAAEEFKSLFKQVSGLDLLIVSKAPKPTGNIFIGPAFLRTFDLGEEGLRIRIEKDNIFIAGGRPRGTLYGVYEFFERYLDVRFLTFDHTYVSEAAKSREIPFEEHVYRPVFSFRWSYYKENSDRPEFAAKLRVNTVTHSEKLGGTTGQKLINHSLYALLPVEKYGKEHPEYFALVNGERKLEVGGGGPEVCSTNPAVVDIITEAVLKQIAENPAQTNFSVSQNDNDQYCRCPNCAAVDEKEGTPMGSHMQMLNTVAERVKQKYPNVKLGTLAYWYTRKSPKNIKPLDNIQIQLCSIECCTLHSIDDPNCAKNREFCADMEAWKKISNDIWIWNYNTNFSNYNLPFPNLRSISKNVRFFSENNVKGVFMQANGNGNSGEFCDLRNYVISRCLWNPKQDSWKLTEEFCRLHYGKAAGPILEYLTLIHDNAQKMGLHPNCFPSPKDVGLTPEVVVKSYGLFQQALAKADSDEVRARVEKASISIYRAMLEVGYAKDNASVKMPLSYAETADRYIELCKRYNMTRASEGQPVEDYIKAIEERKKEFK